MTAIIRHELRSHFHGIVAYLFMAVTLAFIGIYTSLYCLKAMVVNYEYVLGAACFIFFIIVPVLTMKVFAEERKQRTDQLLYSLPLSMTQVVLGKYIALVAIFTIPMVIVCAYPLILSSFGDIYLPHAFGTILAYYIMGCAFIAVGMFISSLTENQAIAAGLCFFVIMLNYFLNTFSNYIDTSSRSSFLALCVCIALLALIWWLVTKNYFIALAVGAVLMVANAALYKVKATLYEGLVPGFLGKISLFQRFYTVVDGVFDLTSIIFYFTVIGLFVFLTVQSLEKRRWS